MAGDWIKFESSTPDKPEVWEIANSLNIDPDAVIGKLLRIWIWYDQQTENGNAPSVTKLLLDRLVGVNNFCNCVIKCGWMSESDGMLVITNFERHNGKTAKNRALSAKRQAQFRDKNSNDKVTINALPREEKRRDIKNNKKSSLTFTGWLKSLAENGEKPISESDPIFAYADEAGIPHDYLRITWIEFRAEFSSVDKRQKDWRAHFRNFVRKNYYKLWWIDNGEYKLTSRGQQAMLAMQSGDKKQ